MRFDLSGLHHVEGVQNINGKLWVLLLDQIIFAQNFLAW